MTPKEARANIAGIQGIITDAIPVCNINGDWEKYTMTLDEAVKALEKRIPKKPKNMKWYEESNSREYIYLCPVCKAEVSYCYINLENGDRKSFKDGYCTACGQKLDWSEEE